MNFYAINYSGNSKKITKKLAMFPQIVCADTPREAVIIYYSANHDDAFFPQEDGSIKDCDGDEICSAISEQIEYDGGFYSAELIISD